MPRSKSKALERRADAVSLRKDGYTYEQIAQQLGYANRGTVYRIVDRAHRERQADDIDTHRAIEVERLDAAEVGLWDLALNSSSDMVRVRAFAEVVNLSKQRSKILGLDDHAPQPEAAQTVFVDYAIRKLRRTHSCRITDGEECGFDPKDHHAECPQTAAMNEALSVHHQFEDSLPSNP